MKCKLLLTLTMVLFSQLCFAFSGQGGGTEADPYVITDVFQLQEMNEDPNAHYILANDIDASDTVTWNGGAGFEPVGSEAAPFKGSFDGKGFVIGNLYILRPSLVGVGLFGRAHEGALITNIGLEDANIFGHRYVGALIGSVYGAEVSYCWSTGIVKGQHDYQAKIGGLLGAANGAGTLVYECFSEAKVEGLGGAHQVGGFSGYNGHGSIIRDCFATGDVSGYIKIGGFVGDNVAGSEGGFISKCYSTGKVTGSGGGLVGHNWLSGKTYDSYWDINTSGKSYSRGGSGRTTDQMMQQGTFVNWDFENVWGIDENESYPYLVAFYVKPELVEIEVAGPEQIKEDSEVQYKAIAIYDDGSEEDITDKCDWYADDVDFAGIDTNGLFWCDMAIRPDQSCVIYAEYETDANEVLTAEKEIAILAMCSSDSALSFDGVDDYVGLANPVIRTKEFTVMAWAKHFGPGGGNHNTNRIFTQRNGVPGNNSSTVNLNVVNYYDQDISYGRQASFQIRSSSGRLQRISTEMFPENQWVYYCGTVDSDSIKLYVNGNLVDEQQNQQRGFYDVSIDHVLIGKAQYGDVESFFNGQIDEVAIFDRALSAEEIKYNMYNKLSGDEAGLVGYWDFDEGIGNIAHDKSGNGNDGQLGSTAGVENSDPNWTSPGAPAICTKPALVKRNIEMAIDIKHDVLDDLSYAMEAEKAANEMLRQMQGNNRHSYQELIKNIMARVNIFRALIMEKIAQSKINASIEHLETAISDEPVVAPQRRQKIAPKASQNTMMLKKVK